MNSEVTIIGAGIGGLSAALCLQHFGIKVKIYEQAMSLGEVGAGLTLTANSTHVLKEVGLLDELVSLSNQPGSGIVRHWKTGEVLFNTRVEQDSLNQYGAPICQIHRADLHNMLVKAVQKNDADTLILDHKLNTIKQNGDEVTITFTNGNTIKAGLVIACDGVRSAIRDQLYPAEDVAFTGQVAFRGLVPVKDLDESVITPSSALSIGPGRFFLRYLVRDKTLVNFVAVTTTDSWKDEGWSTPATTEEVLALYEDWDENVRSVIAATPEGKLFKWALCGRGPLPSWVNGRVALLGDACHPTLPFLGQGAVMALEDAMVLARCLNDFDDYKEALEHYDGARRERCDKLCAMAADQGDKYQSEHPENYTLELHKEGQNDWVFGYNPVTIPI